MFSGRGWGGSVLASGASARPVAATVASMRSTARAGCHAHVFVGMLFNHAHADMGMAPRAAAFQFKHLRCKG